MAEPQAEQNRASTLFSTPHDEQKTLTGALIIHLHLVEHASRRIGRTAAPAMKPSAARAATSRGGMPGGVPIVAAGRTG